MSDLHGHLYTFTSTFNPKTFFISPSNGEHLAS